MIIPFIANIISLITNILIIKDEMQVNQYYSSLKVK
jgi:hypothetical protein